MTSPSSSGVVLLFGVSSFTGAWFAHDLAAHGFQVYGVLTRPLQDYDGVHEARLRWISNDVQFIEAAPMGSPRLVAAVTGLSRIDAVGWHHAVVGDYRATNFPLGAAIDACLLGSQTLADLLAERGCRGAVTTRSVFESGQGIPANGPPIGRYAIAKRAISESLNLAMTDRGLPTVDFTICNPVGAFESPRFTTYLIGQWAEGNVPVLRAPQWVRDNIPAPLLAFAYRQSVQQAISGQGGAVTPSFWPMANRDWAGEISREFGARLPIKAEFAEATSPDTSEPQDRTGAHPIQAPSEWDSQTFWDTYAEYYGQRLGLIGESG